MKDFEITKVNYKEISDKEDVIYIYGQLSDGNYYLGYIFSDDARPLICIFDINIEDYIDLILWEDYEDKNEEAEEYAYKHQINKYNQYMTWEQYKKLYQKVRVNYPTDKNWDTIFYLSPEDFEEESDDFEQYMFDYFGMDIYNDDFFGSDMPNLLNA